METHSCCHPDSDNTEETKDPKDEVKDKEKRTDSNASLDSSHKYPHTLKLTNEELSQHLKYTCKRNKCCSDCDIDFDSLTEMKAHLQHECPYVKVQCDNCDSYLTRKEFKEHPCYLVMNEKTLQGETSETDTLKEEIKKLKDEIVQL